MKLIVGLGNPGEKYEQTRHNLGFVILEQFFKDHTSAEKTVWNKENKLKSDVAEIHWQPKQGKEEKVLLAKPSTYMNNSGLAVELLATYYKIPIDSIWIIHDDIDLPLGTLRIRFGGGTAGHRGVISVMDHLKTDKFWRFRLGIGHPKRLLETDHQHAKIRKDIDEFVLDDFNSGERGKVKDLIHHGAKAIAMALEEGLEPAMNKFNTK